MDVHKYDGNRVIVSFGEALTAVGRVEVRDDGIYLEDAWFVPANPTGHKIVEHSVIRAYLSTRDGVEVEEDPGYRFSHTELNPDQIAIITRIDDLEADKEQNDRNGK